MPARDAAPPSGQLFQQMLFSKIVPNCKKLGLLDAGDGWLRQQFDELGVIQFEDWADTGEEYESLRARPSGEVPGRCAARPASAGRRRPISLPGRRKGRLVAVGRGHAAGRPTLDRSRAR